MELPTCNDCGVDLIPGENWPPSRQRNKTYRCTLCNTAYSKRYYHANIEQERTRRDRLREVYLLDKPERLIMDETVLQRFYAKVIVDLRTGCWLWQGGKTKRGYGVFQTGHGLYEVYNASYQHFIGPVPIGLELGHTLPNDKCASPEHVRPITHIENLRESENMNWG